MKCPFCNSKNQKPQELCLNCGRVLSYKNIEPTAPAMKEKLVIKDYVPQRKNRSLPLGMITIGVVILLLFLVKTRPTGFFSNQNPFFTPDQIRENEKKSLDFYYLGLRSRKKNNPEKAIEYFEKTIAMQKIRQPESYYHLGLIKLKQKDYVKAKSYFTKAIEMDNEFINPRLILEGIDYRDNFRRDFENNTVKLHEFSRIWQITKLYTRMWILIKLDALEEHSTFTVRIPATYAPNKQNDIMVYGTVGRYDVKVYDEKMQSSSGKKKILRNSLVQFHFEKGYHEFMFTIQAPFFEGVNPVGQVNIVVKPMGRAVWNEFFALPSKKQDSGEKWRLKGFGRVKGPLKISFEINDDYSWSEPFDGFKHLGFRKKDPNPTIQ